MTIRPHSDKVREVVDTFDVLEKLTMTNKKLDSLHDAITGNELLGINGIAQQVQRNTRAIIILVAFCGLIFPDQVRKLIELIF